MDEIYEQILKMSYAWFSNKETTPENLNTYIENMKNFHNSTDLDHEKLYKMLESAHNIFINDIKILEDKSDHEEWFNPITGSGLKREIEWHYWQHYKDYLTTHKNWTKAVVDSLDDFSGKILSRFEDPQRVGGWDRRGMVVGSVQSGKTANYTALITKATDAGYKLIIILAGVHNSLRSQTQARINEEFVGYDVQQIQFDHEHQKKIGVGKVFRSHKFPHTLTSGAEDGDFKSGIAKQVGIMPSIDGKPIILIVKKNVTILKNLTAWATTFAENVEGGRKIVKGIPLLLIDDESDYASVNTRKQELSEDGKELKEWKPTTTNMRIRELLYSFEKSIYVGYTATPYANIFIHKDNEHPDYGPDLFPKHFLVNLQPASNYIGPEKFFGIAKDTEKNFDEVEGLPLYSEITDSDDIIPPKHKSDFNISKLPPSLENAIKSFILVCASRRLRKKGPPHCSMLIHVTRYVTPQKQVVELVSALLKILTARIQSGSDKLIDFKDIWESDFLKTSIAMKESGLHGEAVYSWEEIKEVIFDEIRLIGLLGINGDIGDILNYRESDLMAEKKKNDLGGKEIPWHERGVRIIAVGGDKLSRGLTLEGLVISYYLRASKMYDTLMQMGRWFGYRDGFLDLCRIYTTNELFLWYRHIALANKELREEFELMDAKKSNPEKFGLKVRNHPGLMTVTSAGKSRATKKMLISFEGRRSQTIVFDPTQTSHNLKNLNDFIESFKHEPEPVPNSKKLLWKKVSYEKVVNFLQNYRTQDNDIRTVDPDLFSKYIMKQVDHNDELVKWNILLISNDKSKKDIELYPVSVADCEINCVIRRPFDARSVNQASISLKTILNPIDESLDLSSDQLQGALNLANLNKPKNKKDDYKINDVLPGYCYRDKRNADTGLLIIYLTYYPQKASENNDIRLKNKGESEEKLPVYGINNDPQVGFVISFPGSKNAEGVEYIVNSTFFNEDVLDEEIEESEGNNGLT